MLQTPIVEIRNVSFGYEAARPVLRDIDLTIPRGAVDMGRVLADELDGEIDVVLVRKLRSPDSAEFAVGAIDEGGWAYVADYAASAGADADLACASSMSRSTCTTSVVQLGPIPKR